MFATTTVSLPELPQLQPRLLSARPVNHRLLSQTTSSRGLSSWLGLCLFACAWTLIPITANGTNVFFPTGGCFTGTFTVPSGANYVDITAIGEAGMFGKAVAGNSAHASGAGGDGGMVRAIVAVTPGQILWAAPKSTMFKINDAGGGGAGGRGSFISTVAPNSRCDALAAEHLLIVAGGGGGGASESTRGTGGSGGPAGAANGNGVGGGNGGNNDSGDGGGGGGGSQTGGGYGGAGGYSWVGSEVGSPGGAGGYFRGGEGGYAAPRSVEPTKPGGGGGTGFYGGGGGGGDRAGGAGGGGGGSNYVANTIPANAPTSTGAFDGLLYNGSIKLAPKVQITPYFTTSTTIASSPNPSVAGQSVTITVTIDSSGDAAPYGGMVRITNGTTTLATVSSSGGVATFTTNALALGSNYLQATYQGFTSTGEIDLPSSTHGQVIGGLIVPYTHVVNGSTAPPTPVAPSMIQQPDNQTTTYGSVCSFSNGFITNCFDDVHFVASAGGTPPPALQWQVAASGSSTFVEIPGAQSPDLFLRSAVSMSGSRYRAVFSSSAGTVTSNPATLTVNKASLRITANNKSMGYAGQVPPFDVNYRDPAYSGAVFRNGDDETSLTGTLVCTTAITITSTTPSGDYAINCTGLTAANYNITFVPGTLTIQPASQQIVVDALAVNSNVWSERDLGTSYAIVAYGGGSANPVTYSVAPETSPASACTVTAAGVVSFTDVNRSGATPQGFCFINLNQAGNAVYPAAPQIYVGFIVKYRAPSVITQPVDQSIAVGQTATFTVAVTGAPQPTVQWQVSSDPSATPPNTSYSNINGATSTTLTVANATSALDGNKYRVYVTNNPGQTVVYSNFDITSNPAKLTVTGPPVVSLQPLDVTVSTGSTASFTSTAVGNPGATVQWQVSSNNGGSYFNISGATSTTLTITTDYTLDGNLYRAMFFNTDGAATSNPALLHVYFNAFVTSEPGNQTVMVGQTATFTVGHLGYPAATLQWQENGSNTNLAIGNIQGATAATLSLPNVTKAMNGFNYRVLLYQGGSFIAASNRATLTVNSATPTMVTAASGAVAVGATVSDGATLSGGYNLTGTVVFNLYGAVDTTCAAAPVFTSTTTVAGTGTYASAAFATVAVGTHRWIASYSGDANNNPVTSSCNASGQNVVVTQASNVISFGVLPNVVVGSAGTVTATATSGLAVTFGTATPASICIVSAAGGVIGVGVGSCVVIANQGGNTNYAAASPVTQPIAIGQGSQSIGFGIAPGVVAGGTGTVTATATSGLVVTFSTNTPASICTVSAAGSVAGIGVGSCVVIASQGGNTNYAAAPPVTQPIAIGQGNQSISFVTGPNVVVGGSAAVTATATSGLTVSFSTVSSTCSVSATGLVTGWHAGLCVVAAAQAGNANYLAAPPQSQNLTIGQANSSTALSASPAASVFGQSVALTAVITTGNPSPSGTVAFTDGGVGLSGCGTVALVNGQAQCATSSLTVTAHGLRATYAGDADTVGSFNSTALSVVVGKAATGVSVTPPAAITLGSPVTVTASAAVTSPGAGALTGVITIGDGTVSCNFTLPATGCSLTPTSGGSKTLTATYVPDVAASVSFTGSSSTANLTVNPSTPNMTLTSSANPGVFGQSITLTATIAPSAGSPLATGNVNFTDGSTAVMGCSGVALVAVGATSSVATCVTSNLSTASHPLTTSYSGDASNVAASANLTQVINRAATTTTITPPGTVTLGSSVSVPVAVTANLPGAGTPGGTVNVSDGSASCVVALINGAGSCVLTPLAPAGGQSLTASYVASTDFAASTATSALTVNAASAGMALASSVNPSAFGQSVTLTATVTPIAGNPVATGSINFTDGGASLCASVTVVNGVATCSTSALSVTSHAMQASYGGDVNTAAASATLVQVVNQASSQITITSSPNPARAGEQITFTATVVQLPPSSQAGAGVGNSDSGLKAAAQASAAPTGNVTILDGSRLLATVPLDGNGQASFSTGELSAGSHAITATYNGDSGRATATITLALQIDALPVPTLSTMLLALLTMLLAASARAMRRRPSQAH